ncbi:MAG TPA: coproporphyrinogen-III oxidase family protein [Candidatus Limnocylindrales bacterium]
MTATPETPPVVGARPPVALYLHVPFCVSLCPYCDFVVVAGAAARGPASRVAGFLEALTAEVRLRADALDAAFGGPSSGARPALDSVYVGGGTPSLLPADDVARLLALVGARFGLAPDAEVTLEANPGADERGDAAALARAGVNRLSLGAQAMDGALLRRLGRRHSPDDVHAAVAEARAAGIPSVSVDVLYDVPGQSLDAWGATLDATLALGVDHVSAYALTLDDPDAEGLTGPLGDHLPTRAGARRWREAAVREQDEDRAAGQYRLAVDRLGAAGFRGYEISNWARPGHESRHNLAYWRRLPHEAAGPGAHAFDGVVRRWNAARLDAYVASLSRADPSLPPGGSESISPAQAAAERAILGLRLDSGLALGEASAEASLLAPHLSWGIDAGLLEAFDGADGEPRVRLTTDGRLLSNELFARLV